MRDLDLVWGRTKILMDWEKWLEAVKYAIKKTLSSDLIGAYLFGSATTGDLAATSDVDLLIIVRKPPPSIIKRSEIKERLLEASGLPPIHPFEIHIVDEEEAKVYFYHIGKNYIKIL